MSWWVKMKESLVKSINALPPLSQTILEINKIYNNPDAGVADMAKVIEKDPMVMANLLKTANSPLYGFAREIKSVTQAVSLFGLSTTRAIVLGNSIRKLLNVDMEPYKVSSEQFANISALQAKLVFEWLRLKDKSLAEDLQLIAFLQETGKILIASEIIKDDETYAFSSEIELTNDVAGVERSFVGSSASEVSGYIFEYWKFDDPFLEKIYYADNPNEAPDEYQKAAQILHVVKAIVPINKPLAQNSIAIGLKKAEKFGLDVASLEEAIQKVQKVVNG